MMKHKVKSLASGKKLFFIFHLVGLAFLVASYSHASWSSLTFQFEDEIFNTSLKGRFVMIKDDTGTYSASIEIQEIEGAYIAHIGRVQPGNGRWHIELEGYQPRELLVELFPGQRTIKKVVLTPTFGSLYAWGVDAEEPRKPMSVPMKVRVGKSESSAFACEGVNIFPLTPGDYTINAEAQGFEPVSQSCGVRAGKSMEMKLIFRRKPGQGSIKIVARNARVPGIPIEKELKIEAAGKNARGKASEGVTLYDLAPGKYTVNGNVEGFSPGTIQVEAVAGKTVEVELFLSPLLTENEIARIILTWEDDPPDLDAYLCLPGDEQCIYWQNKVMKVGNTIVAKLDVDAKYGKGPETITIYEGHNGLYKYYVVDYLRKFTIGGSNAKVEVYTKDGKSDIFFIPTDCKELVWEIMELKVNGTNVWIEEKYKCHTPEMRRVNKF